MSAEKNLGILLTDLILEIISRLPSKSVARCLCLSKLWAFLLTPDSPYFTELFLTHSKTRLRLLFVGKKSNNEWCLYSCPQPQISSTNSTSSISVSAEFHMCLPKTDLLQISSSFSGLIYFHYFQDLNNPKLCNPSTRHLVSLPQLTKTVHSYFRYDPINKHVSVLVISHPGPPPGPAYGGLPSNYRILRLGSERSSWRSLNCSSHHYPFELNICINGVLYYMACLVSNPHFKIVCLDLNSEEFKFIDQPCDPRQPELLVNFKGKLGAINAKWVGSSKKRSHLEVSLWVLEDIEKQEWSKHVYDILTTKLWNKKGESYCIVGMTAMGDIVLTYRFITPPLCVYFFNLEKKSLLKVEIKDFKGFRGFRFYGWVDYVEDLKVLKWS